jgi:hypothetical protein
MADASAESVSPFGSCLSTQSQANPIVPPNPGAIEALATEGPIQPLEVQPWITIPLQWMRMADDSGSRQTHLSAPQVQAWVDYANQVYSVANVRFTFDPLSSFSTVRNTIVNTMTNSSANLIANQLTRCFPGKMVIIDYWGSDPTWATGGGFSSATCDYAAMPGFYDTGGCEGQNFTLFAHEVGHHLGLPHTFSAVYQNLEDATTNFAAMGNNPAVWDGDGFSDTPPYPQIADQGCPPSPSQLTINGVLLNLPRSNIMSYFGEGCTITTQQTAVVRFLANNYLRNRGHLPSNQGLLNPIEADGLTVTQSSNAPRSTQGMSGYVEDGWNANDQLFIRFGNGGSLTLRVSVAQAGQKQLYQ